MSKATYLLSKHSLLNGTLLNRTLLSGVLLTSTLLLPGAAMATEEPKYTILSQNDEFELRRYGEQLAAQTWVSGDQNEASRKGFKILADYIFGNNTASNGESSKISMTAPVAMKFEEKQSDTKKNEEHKKHEEHTEHEGHGENDEHEHNETLSSRISDDMATA
ncbi:MAG: heme-binding protein, partial [Psychrobacter sp.]|nr:heme-binding protein [Psychrobacter sp.]